VQPPVLLDLLWRELVGEPVQVLCATELHLLEGHDEADVVGMHPDLASRGHVAAELVLIHDLFRYSRGLLLLIAGHVVRCIFSILICCIYSAQKRKSIRAGPGAQVRHEQENQLE
jgi:hypothetical protein